MTAPRPPSDDSVSSPFRWPCGQALVTAAGLLLVGSFLLACGEAPPAPQAPCPEGYERGDSNLCLIPTSPPDLTGLPWGVEEEDCDDFDGSQPIDAGCTSTHQGDIQFTTPQEMVDFCASYDCVAGGIDIGGDETQLKAMSYGIPDLSGLSCLKSSRYLYIGQNGDLTNIELPNLVTVGGGLSIIDNPLLESIHAPVLLRGGGDVSIQYNDRLTSLSFESLLWVDTFLFVVSNASLPPEEGYTVRDGLCHVGGTSSILWNASGATVLGSVTRSAEPSGDGVGSLVVLAMDQATGPEVLFATELDPADLSAPDSSIPYTLANLPTRDEPYWLWAWLDDDGSGSEGGPSPGDLLGSTRVEAQVTTKDSFVIDLVLDAVQ